MRENEYDTLIKSLLRTARKSFEIEPLFIPGERKHHIKYERSWELSFFLNKKEAFSRTGKIITYGGKTLINTYKCKKTGQLISEVCQDTTCEWRLKNETFLNCTWVACNYGPFTLEEVGEMMGVTRERIRQIEAKALKKLQHKKRREQLKDFALPDNEWEYS